jgi:hypothetical protein
LASATDVEDALPQFATDTPQAFSVALVLPIQQGSEVTLVITEEGVHCRPAHIHQV